MGAGGDTQSDDAPPTLAHSFLTHGILRYHYHCGEWYTQRLWLVSIAISGVVALFLALCCGVIGVAFAHAMDWEQPVHLAVFSFLGVLPLGVGAAVVAGPLLVMAGKYCYEYFVLPRVV